MKSYVISFASSIILLSSNLNALLPPFYESRKEYLALLNSKELEDKLGSGQMIQSISRTDNGFEIITPKYVLNVNVIYKHTRKIGPAEFQLEFNQLQPRPEK